MIGILPPAAQSGGADIRIRRMPAPLAARSGMRARRLRWSAQPKQPIPGGVVAVPTRQRLAAYALVFDDAGRVLLSREPDGRGRLPARWLLPGGGVEPGEHPEQAVIREVREETGMGVRVGALREVLSDVSRVGRRRRRLHTVRLIYRATVLPGEPSAPERPSDCARWCTAPEWQVLPIEPFAARLLAADPG
jgi:8-oxo-dGTP diphosphatase